MKYAETSNVEAVPNHSKFSWLWKMTLVTPQLVVPLSMVNVKVPSLTVSVSRLLLLAGV